MAKTITRDELIEILTNHFASTGDGKPVRLRLNVSRTEIVDEEITGEKRIRYELINLLVFFPPDDEPELPPKFNLIVTEAS